MAPPLLPEVLLLIVELTTVTSPWAPMAPPLLSAVLLLSNESVMKRPPALSDSMAPASPPPPAWFPMNVERLTVTSPTASSPPPLPSASPPVIVMSVRVTAPESCDSSTRSPAQDWESVCPLPFTTMAVVLLRVGSPLVQVRAMSFARSISVVPEVSHAVVNAASSPTVAAPAAVGSAATSRALMRAVTPRNATADRRGRTDI